MVTNLSTNTTQLRAPAPWPVMNLAIFAALGELLIALNVLTVGNLNLAEMPATIVYLAAACYVVAGLLILSRGLTMLMSGAIINGAMILFFHGLHPIHPPAAFFTGGDATTAAQLLLEGLLLLLIVVSWRKRSGPFEERADCKETTAV